VPISPGADVTYRRDDEPECDKTLYMRGVGALMYISTVSRPDISTAVSILARSMSNPGERHWQLLKGVLRYIRGTAEQGITYSAGQPSITGWTDADYACCKDTRRSRSGYVFTLYGGAVSWGSKLQSVVAQSSAESEYIAAAAAARELKWLRRLAADMGILHTGPITLRADNQACISMGHNTSDSARTKHIDVAYHFLRSAVAREVLTLQHVPSTHNPADAFTKPLAEAKFSQFIKMFGMG
jgi:hypothetical protein